jgi:hypothetical protein
MEPAVATRLREATNTRVHAGNGETFLTNRDAAHFTVSDAHGVAANDGHADEGRPVAVPAVDGIGAAHSQDIFGILTTANVPEQVPLQMEAAAPVYLRPRDAITGLHRLLSSAWTTSV